MFDEGMLTKTCLGIFFFLFPQSVYLLFRSNCVDDRVVARVGYRRCKSYAMGGAMAKLARHGILAAPVVDEKNLQFYGAAGTCPCTPHHSRNP